MGVQKWTRVLKEEGFLPDVTVCKCCSTSLWRDNDAMDASNAFEHVETIPKGSELHIDGNGLVFYLNAIAFARLVENTLGAKKGRNQKSPCARRKNIQASTVRGLLPSMMPLKLVSSVTAEFVEALRQKHGLKVKVYWDGEKRRVFKQETDEKRQERFPEEWSHLQQYCVNGILPPMQKFCELEKLLPKSRLCKAEVYACLRKCKVSQVICEEEADPVMAKAVSGNSDAYVLGQDSDFCFFPDCNYIPLSTLDASTPQMATAVVIRRDKLADVLDLPDEAAMIELAILMGNDFVNPSTAQLNDIGAHSLNFKSIVEFLREKGSGYRVTSPSEDVEEALSFVRALYGLDAAALGDVPFSEQSDMNEDASFAGDDILLSSRARDEDATIRPSVPSDMPIELLKFDPRYDKSVKDSILRCLQAYVGLQSIEGDSDSAPMISQEHIDVFREMDLEQGDPSGKVFTGKWRPVWGDIGSAYLIEKLLALLTVRGSSARLVQLPSSLFDQHYYHFMLRNRRLLLDSATPAPEAFSETDVPAITDESPDVPLFRQTLPIDEHETEIIETIKKNRVSIIQGDTGCGKSSRIPIMILKTLPPDPALKRVEVFISQPRRIAAKGLVERLRQDPEYGSKFALRLGHGIREYESNNTQAWYCTTGYLVRLLANHPERFNNVSHLILDEIHERAVDLDLLCLLCRRLLRNNSHIRLILMSATLSAELYQGYFGTTVPPIRVGAMRFPVAEIYLDDFADNVTGLPKKAKTLASSVMQQCDKLRCKAPPSLHYMESLINLVSYLIVAIGRGGTSILVFVPGINEIVAIMDKIEQIFIPGVNMRTFPVHSDIPFDDQIAIFDAMDPEECRIIVATNSAESSLTLPALDHVIDLGLCRQVMYDDRSHRQLLASAWISRASAIQRSGRTGRIREGCVYRLYTKNCFRNHMAGFELGEMLRIPLDTVILMLKQILPNEESVSQVLQECLEPPNIATIERSFESLYDNRFITSPDEDANVTELGNFVSSLGIDMALGRLIGLGIQYGVGPEAIQLAGVLSFPKQPWIQSSPLIHEVSEFNRMSALTFTSRCHFDAGLFSEPFAMMAVIWEFERAVKKHQWCGDYGLVFSRVKRLTSACSNLQKRVADFFGVPHSKLNLTGPPDSFPNGKLTILRIVQAWVFHDTVIKFKPKDYLSYDPQEQFSIELQRNSARIERKHLDAFLFDDRHRFILKSSNQVEQQGQFQVVDSVRVNDSSYVDGLEERLLSYCIENNFSVVICTLEKLVLVYFSLLLPLDTIQLLSSVVEASLPFQNTIHARPFTGTARGIAERSCGRWRLSGKVDDQQDMRSFKKVWARGMKKQNVLQIKKSLVKLLSTSAGGKIAFVDVMSHSNKKSHKFRIELQGDDTSPVPDRDVRDIFSSIVEVKSRIQEKDSAQSIVFPPYEGGPWTFKKQDAQSNTWGGNALFKTIPEGARLLSVLVSASRRERVLKLHPMVDEEDGQKEGGGNGEGEEVEEVEYLAIYPDSGKACINGRWKMHGTNSEVFVFENSVPSSTVPAHGQSVLCCCANALFLQKGGVKVEGMTLLPPGEMFFALCEITFGKRSADDVEWLEQLMKEEKMKTNVETEDFLERCAKATSVHESTADEEGGLVCFTGNVVKLLEVFDGLSGRSCCPWEGIEHNVFTTAGLNRSRTLNRSERSSFNDENQPTGRWTPKKTNADRNKCLSPSKSNQNSRMTDRQEKNIEYNNQSPNEVAFPVGTEQLFVTELIEGAELSKQDLPSPNILALVVKHYESRLSGRKKKRSGATQMKLTGKKPNWILREICVGNKSFFQAQFDCNIPFIPKHQDKLVPKWIKVGKRRPTTIAAAMACIPDGSVESLGTESMEVVLNGDPHVFFDTVERSIQMESAFWLEKQFWSKTLHWFQNDVKRMVDLLHHERERRDGLKTAKQIRKKEAIARSDVPSVHD